MSIDQLLWDGLLAGVEYLPEANVEVLSDLITERIEAQIEDAHRVIAIEDCTPVSGARRPLIAAAVAASMCLIFAVGWFTPRPSVLLGNTSGTATDQAASQDQQTSNPVSQVPVAHRPEPTKYPLLPSPRPSLSPTGQTVRG